MRITLYVFDKKYNSTARPGAGVTARILDGQLKQATDILTPSIVFKKMSDGVNPTGYTYAYLDAFSKYYYITNWSWDLGVWTADMQVDALATYKTQIGASSHYVLRSDTSYDGEITDTLYPAKCKPSLYRGTVTTPFISDTSRGTYVVGIINNSNNASLGAVTYYAMSFQELGNLKNFLMQDSFISSCVDPTQSLEISWELLKTIYNPFQYIASCKYFDFPVTAAPGTQVTGIPLGWWTLDSSISGKQLTATGLSIYGKFTFDSHPQASSRGAYLNYNPYSEYILTCTPFPSIPLDRAMFPSGAGGYELTVDYTTGLGFLSIFDKTDRTGALVIRTESPIGADIQLAQITSDYIGSATQLVGQIGGGIKNAITKGATGLLFGGAGGAISGAISGALSGLDIGGVYNSLQSAMPMVSTSGGGGGTVGTFQWMLTSKHYPLPAENKDRYGRPLCQTKTINTLSGYVLCADGDVAFSCLAPEKAAIASHLTSGFYYE